MKLRSFLGLVLLPAFSPGLLAEGPAAAARAHVAQQLSVCVFCGASELPSPKYAEAAHQLGGEIARRGWTLVWGGAKTGLMGAVARGAKESGGRVVGVLPEFIRNWEVAYDDADEMMTVTTMHDRKMLLQTRADAFVILPGGLGTLDELGDTLELRQLGLHRKPVVLLNQDGYYDALLAFIEHSIAEKFSRRESREKLLVVRTVAEAVAALAPAELAAEKPKL